MSQCYNRRMDAALRLEQAQGLLDQGRPARASALLKGPFPPVLRREADFLRAEALRSQGFFDRAAALYRHALAGAGGDRGLRLEASLALASVHRSLGDVAEARRRWKDARSAAGRLDDRLRLEDALIDRADSRWASCLRKLGGLLADSRRQRDWAGAAFLLWATGGARRFSGDLAGSERDFRESLALARRAGDPAGQAYALFGLGGVTRIRGKLADSERFYREARRRLSATDDVFGKAYAECGLANSLRQQGKLAEAQSHYRKAHVLYSSLGDAVDLAYVDWGLGKIALQRGDLKKADRRLRAALKGFEPHEHRGAALSLLELSRALHAGGRTAEAERLFDASVRRSRKAGLHAHLEIFT